MLGRNKKRIEALENEVASLKAELKTLRPQISALKGQVDTLIDEMVVAHLDAEPYIAVLQECGKQEKVDILLRIKKGYENKLKRFIRSAVAKKKPKIKTTTDGKETPEATE